MIPTVSISEHVRHGLDSGPRRKPSVRDDRRQVNLRRRHLLLIHRIHGEQYCAGRTSRSSRNLLHILDHAHASSLDAWDDRRSSIRRTLVRAFRADSGSSEVRSHGFIDRSVLPAAHKSRPPAIGFNPGRRLSCKSPQDHETFAVPSLVLRSQVSRIVPSADDVPDGACVQTPSRSHRSSRGREQSRSGSPSSPASTRSSTSHCDAWTSRCRPNGGTIGPAVDRGWTGRPQRSPCNHGIIAGATGERDVFTRNGPIAPYHHCWVFQRNRPPRDSRSNGRGHATAGAGSAIRVVDGFSLVGIPAEATCFDVPSRPAGTRDASSLNVREAAGSTRNISRFSRLRRTS